MRGFSLIAAILVSFTAAAEAPSPAAESAPKAAEAAPARPSEAARKNSVAGLSGRIGNIAGAVFGGGFDGYWAPNERLQVGLLLTGGTRDLKDELDTTSILVTKAEVSASLAIIQARWFFGNSFSAVGGFGSREVTGSFAAETFSGDAVEQEIVVSSSVISFGIGNVWMWENGFFFGCDWLGMVVPQKSSVSVTTKTRGAASENIQKFQDDGLKLANEIGKSTSATTVLFTIGGAMH